MHTETSALLPSHDPTPHHTPSTHHHHEHHQPAEHHHGERQHHHQDQNHHHDHDHRHRHHHDPHHPHEYPVEVIAPPPTLWQQTQSRDVYDDDQTRRGTSINPAYALLVALAFGFFVFHFGPWNQRLCQIPGQESSWSPSTININAADVVPETSPNSVEGRARAILATTPLIDGHNDLAIFIREYYKNNITSHDFKSSFANGSMPLNVDLARLRSGQAGGAFWSAFVLCPQNASYDMSNANYASATSDTLEQIDLLRRLQAQYPRDFTPAIPTTMDPSGREHMLLQWHATRTFFGPISIEGLHQIPPSSPFSTLRLYHALGVRMATLTWNCHNPFADASLLWNTWTSPITVVNGVSRPDEGAVTTRGKKVLKEMNRLGMIIDLSHTSYWTQKAVLSTNEDGNRLSRAPVVFSHSSAYSICPHPRNVQDDILDLVAKTDSLVMVNFSPGFISCVSPSDTLATSHDPHFSIPDYDDKNNTLHQVARHIVYIGERIGYDHVGLGSDFDGMGSEHPRGLDGVDKYPDLVAELLQMGVSDVDARKIVGGNLLRVWKDVDDVAAKMIAEGVEPEVDHVVGYQG